ncbi:unnamed protein product [Lathyrus sativus]|nr:unnamed protein product [Lathyrus sativus]
MSSEEMKMFKEGINLILNFWWRIRALDEDRKRPYFSKRAFELRNGIYKRFVEYESKGGELSPRSIQHTLRHFMNLLFNETGEFDNTSFEVSVLLCEMYQECSKGNYDSVEVIGLANISQSRRIMGMKAHLNETNGSESGALQGEHQVKLFREQILELLEELWNSHVYVPPGHPCITTPDEPCITTPQQFADDITFWFTQGKKLITQRYLEWILVNTLSLLPISAPLVGGIVKDVAEKVMAISRKCSNSDINPSKKPRVK